MKLKTKLLLCLVTLSLLTASISSCAQKDPYVDDDTDDTPMQVYLIYFDNYGKNDTDSIGSLYPSSQMFYNMISKEGLVTEGIEELKKCIDLEIEDNERYISLGNIKTLADFYQHICNGEILMDYTRNTHGGRGEFELLNSLYNVVENLYDKTFVILNEPIINDETSYGYIDLSCVINMNSRHKNDAFKFVEFMLSEQCQYSDALRTRTIPVNIAAYESAKSDFMNDVLDVSYVSFIGSSYGYSSTPLPSEVKDYYINLVEGVSEYKYIGGEQYILKHVIIDSIDDYTNHKIDFDAMIEEINRKIKLYYSE